MRRLAVAVVLSVALLLHTLAVAAPVSANTAGRGSTWTASDDALDSAWLTTTAGATEIFGAPRDQRSPSPLLGSPGRSSPKPSPLLFSTALRPHRSPYPTRTRLHARLGNTRGGDRPH